MNDYIILDTFKYKTLERSWKPSRPKNQTVRINLSGRLDVTYGSISVYRWQGEIKVDVTPDVGYGDIDDLRATLAKTTGVGYTDHYGTAFTNVHLLGGYVEDSFSPVWDGASNVFYVPVTLIGDT